MRPLFGANFLFAAILLHARSLLQLWKVVPLQLSDLIDGVSFSLTEDTEGSPEPVLDLVITDATWQPSSIGDLQLIDLDGSISDIVRSINLGGQANLFFASDVFDPADLPTFDGRHFTDVLDEGTGDFTVNVVSSGGVINAQIFSDDENNILSDSITLQQTTSLEPAPLAMFAIGLSMLGLGQLKLRRTRAANRRRVRMAI